MEIRLLGPLEIVIDGEFATVGGPRIRRLLASIALADGSVRSTDALIETVWADEEPPDGARRTVMSYVSRLRSAIGEGRVEQIANGYRLEPDSVSTDVRCFERLVAEGQQMFQAGNLTHAVALLEEALGLWRGEPLAEFAGEHWVEPDRVRLSMLRLSAMEDRFAAKIEVGAHAEVLGDLERASDEHPERERLQYLEMLALYRSGRQTEALRRFESTRARLAEMGLEPSPELRELEYRILTHEEALQEPSPEPGSVVRGYQLGDRLGEGAFGTIYLATQPSVGREVAIKVIKPELANDPRFVRRFELEAQLVARLEHPHIVPLYDYWREPSGAYLVMRWLRGGTAEDRLITDGPMPVATVAGVVDEIGGALVAAHARGVIHRDVKPANILFDDDGSAYLADFGIAILNVERPTNVDLSSAGSPLYASPEQVQRGESSIKSDVYSFGVTIYELLTGCSPFPADSVEALLERKLRTAVPSVVPERPDVPPGVDAVLARATAVDPAHRFDGIAELVLAFRAAMVVEPPAVRTRDELGSVELPRAAASRTLVNVQLASVNPYKGLRAFQEADAQDFYGRERLVAELFERVGQQRLVAIVGASGSGKSSLVRAGLVPLVTAQDWFVTTIVPGSHPLEELEDGLLRIATGEVPGLLEQLASTNRGIVRAVRRVLPPDGSELLLVIDQFEEMFTLASEDERESFLQGLIQAIGDERSRIRVVVTIRADFFDRPLRHRGFGELLQDATLNVLPMSRDELTAAIEGPARRLGARFEPGLVDAIESDVGHGAGVLPLLQYALTELYDHRVGDEMTLAGYREIGGVTGALAKRADEVFADLSPDDQAAARRLFTRLVTPGEGVEDTRRRALRSELTIANDAVIDAFGAYRLLSFDRDPATRAPTVEVAHEALIREWQRLRQWLDDDRQGLRMLRHLTTSARAWIDSDRDRGELYRGGRLDAALDWAADHGADLAPDESEFLDAGRALREQEIEEQLERAALRERQNRRLRRSLVGLAIFAVFALVATALALQQRSAASDRADEAAEARATAETRRLVSDAGQLAPANRRVALLLAAEAYRRQPDAASLGALKEVLTQSGDVLGYVGADIEFTDIAWTADGRLVGAHPGGVVVMTTDDQRQLDIPHNGARLVAVRSDDRVVAVAGSDQTVRIFDLISGQQLMPPLDHGSPLTALRFSGDGRLLATGDRLGTVRLFDEHFAERASIDAHSGPLVVPDGVEPPLAHEPQTFTEGVTDVALNADGSVLASVGGAEIRAWDTTNLDPLVRRILTKVDNDSDRQTESYRNATAVGFVNDGDQELLAVADLESVTLWSYEADDLIGQRDLGGSTVASVTSSAVAFGPTGVVAVGPDGQVRSTTTDGVPFILESQLSGELSIAVDNLGERAVVAGEQGGLIISLVGAGLISRSIPAIDRQEVWVTEDGRAVVATQTDRRGSRLWHLEGQSYREVPIPLPVETYSYTGLPFGLSFDEETKSSRERDPYTLEATGAEFDTPGVFALGASTDGRWLATGTRRATTAEPLEVRIHERATGDLVARLDDFATDVSSAVLVLVFSPDGRNLLVGADDGSAVLYATATWEQTGPRLSAGGGAVMEAAYTHDGRLLATVSENGTITFRDPDTLQPDGPLLLGNTDGVQGFSLGPYFSPDDRWMLTISDGELRLFDVAERVMVGGPFPRDETGFGNPARNARFAVTVLDGRAVVWDLDVERWPEIACEAAGRNLTLGEWEQFGPAGEPYRATCDQWPSLSDQSETGGES